tara:strand:+ start:141 stop:359 length:219 start_codon:yes stop_codon:yes gene_type:complete
MASTLQDNEKEDGECHACEHRGNVFCIFNLDVCAVHDVTLESLPGDLFAGLVVILVERLSKSNNFYDISGTI